MIDRWPIGDRLMIGVYSMDDLKHVKVCDESEGGDWKSNLQMISEYGRDALKQKLLSQRLDEKRLSKETRQTLKRIAQARAQQELLRLERSRQHPLLAWMPALLREHLIPDRALHVDVGEALGDVRRRLFHFPFNDESLSLFERSS